MTKEDGVSKRKFYWCGFSEGRPDIAPALGNAAPNSAPQFYGVLYLTRKEARRSYEDVRRVMIREVKGKRP
jgi:hypothetical protein